MRRIVLDTNCLLMSLPKRSPYRKVWDEFLAGRLVFCVSNEIIEEYFEILSQKVGFGIASNVIAAILNNRRGVELVSPHYRFGLIKADPDDNKFTDCAVTAGAELIVSNDSHFAILRTIAFPKVEVASLQEFAAELGGS